MEATAHAGATAHGMATQERLADEVAIMAAHINAATARWLELVLEFERHAGAAIDGCERWLAWQCGISTREAREYVRVAHAHDELPRIRDAFRRGELTFTKVRALARVATPRSDEGLLYLARALIASQLDRALRAYRRVTSAETRETHELEYVDYYWEDDGSLVLRARLPAEDGTVLVRALEAARERVRERRRQRTTRERGGELSADGTVNAADAFQPLRSPNVEALLELTSSSLAAHEPRQSIDRARVVLHVDVTTLSADGPGRSELEDGPAIAPETARRLACDATSVTAIEQNGLPISVGRTRRTVPQGLRRLLEARDDGCRWPGCANRRYLHAHHRTHWAHGGETSLDNLLLLCWHHHRLVHEGGYTIEDAPDGELRFRNRHGVLVPTAPRSPPGSVDRLIHQNVRAGLLITTTTNCTGDGDRMDLESAVAAVSILPTTCT